MLGRLDLTHSAKLLYFLTLLLHCYGEINITGGSQGGNTKCYLLSNRDKTPTQVPFSVVDTQ